MKLRTKLRVIEVICIFGAAILLGKVSNDFFVNIVIMLLMASGNIANYNEGLDHGYSTGIKWLRDQLRSQYNMNINITSIDETDEKPI